MQDRTPVPSGAQQPHRRAAEPTAEPARPRPVYRSQEDELLRRARALDAATDREAAVLRRLLGEGTVR